MEFNRAKGIVQSDSEEDSKTKHTQTGEIMSQISVHKYVCPWCKSYLHVHDPATVHNIVPVWSEADMQCQSAGSHNELNQQNRPRYILSRYIEQECSNIYGPNPLERVRVKPTNLKRKHKPSELLPNTKVSKPNQLSTQFTKTLNKARETANTILSCQKQTSSIKRVSSLPSDLPTEMLFARSWSNTSLSTRNRTLSLTCLSKPNKMLGLRHIATQTFPQSLATDVTTETQQGCCDASLRDNHQLPKDKQESSSVQSIAPSSSKLLLQDFNTKWSRSNSSVPTKKQLFTLHYKAEPNETVRYMALLPHSEMREIVAERYPRETDFTIDITMKRENNESAFSKRIQSQFSSSQQEPVSAQYPDITGTRLSPNSKLENVVIENVIPLKHKVSTLDITMKRCSNSSNENVIPLTHKVSMQDITVESLRQNVSISTDKEQPSCKCIGNIPHGEVFKAVTEKYVTKTDLCTGIINKPAQRNVDALPENKYQVHMVAEQLDSDQSPVSLASEHMMLGRTNKESTSNTLVVTDDQPCTLYYVAEPQETIRYVKRGSNKHVSETETQTLQGKTNLTIEISNTLNQSHNDLLTEKPASDQRVVKPASEHSTLSNTDESLTSNLSLLQPFVVYYEANPNEKAQYVQSDPHSDGHEVRTHTLQDKTDEPLEITKISKQSDCELLPDTKWQQAPSYQKVIPPLREQSIEDCISNSVKSKPSIVTDEQLCILHYLAEPNETVRCVQSVSHSNVREVKTQTFPKKTNVIVEITREPDQKDCEAIPDSRRQLDVTPSHLKAIPPLREQSIQDTNTNRFISNPSLTEEYPCVYQFVAKAQETKQYKGQVTHKEQGHKQSQIFPGKSNLSIGITTINREQSENDTLTDRSSGQHPLSQQEHVPRENIVPLTHKVSTLHISMGKLCPYSLRENLAPLKSKVSEEVITIQRLCPNSWLIDNVVPLTHKISTQDITVSRPCPNFSGSTEKEPLLLDYLAKLKQPLRYIQYISDCENHRAVTEKYPRKGYLNTGIIKKPEQNPIDSLPERSRPQVPLDLNEGQMFSKESNLNLGVTTDSEGSDDDALIERCNCQYPFSQQEPASYHSSILQGNACSTFDTRTENSIPIPSDSIDEQPFTIDCAVEPSEAVLCVRNFSHTDQCEVIRETFQNKTSSKIAIINKMEQNDSDPLPDTSRHQIPLVGQEAISLRKNVDLPTSSEYSTLGWSNKSFTSNSKVLTDEGSFSLVYVREPKKPVQYMNIPCNEMDDIVTDIFQEKSNLSSETTTHADKNDSDVTLRDKYQVPSIRQPSFDEKIGLVYPVSEFWTLSGGTKMSRSIFSVPMDEAPFTLNDLAEPSQRMPYVSNFSCKSLQTIPEEVEVGGSRSHLPVDHHHSSLDLSIASAPYELSSPDISSGSSMSIPSLPTDEPQFSRRCLAEHQEVVDYVLKGVQNSMSEKVSEKLPMEGLPLRLSNLTVCNPHPVLYTDGKSYSLPLTNTSYQRCSLYSEATPRALDVPHAHEKMTKSFSKENVSIIGTTRVTEQQCEQQLLSTDSIEQPLSEQSTINTNTLIPLMDPLFKRFTCVGKDMLLMCSTEGNEIKLLERCVFPNPELDSMTESGTTEPILLAPVEVQQTIKSIADDKMNHPDWQNAVRHWLFFPLPHRSYPISSYSLQTPLESYQFGSTCVSCSSSGLGILHQSRNSVLERDTQQTSTQHKYSESRASQYGRVPIYQLQARSYTSVLRLTASSLLPISDSEKDKHNPVLPHLLRQQKSIFSATTYSKDVDLWDHGIPAVHNALRPSSEQEIHQLTTLKHDSENAYVHETSYLEEDKRCISSTTPYCNDTTNKSSTLQTRPKPLINNFFLMDPNEYSTSQSPISDESKLNNQRIVEKGVSTQVLRTTKICSDPGSIHEHNQSAECELKLKPTSRPKLAMSNKSRKPLNIVPSNTLNPTNIVICSKDNPKHIHSADDVSECTSRNLLPSLTDSERLLSHETKVDLNIAPIINVKGTKNWSDPDGNCTWYTQSAEHTQRSKAKTRTLIGRHVDSKKSILNETSVALKVPTFASAIDWSDPFNNCTWYTQCTGSSSQNQGKARDTSNVYRTQLKILATQALSKANSEIGTVQTATPALKTTQNETEIVPSIESNIVNHGSNPLAAQAITAEFHTALHPVGLVCNPEVSVEHKNEQESIVKNVDRVKLVPKSEVIINSVTRPMTTYVSQPIECHGMFPSKLPANQDKMDLKQDNHEEKIPAMSTLSPATTVNYVETEFSPVNSDSFYSTDNYTKNLLGYNSSGVHSAKIFANRSEIHPEKTRRTGPQTVDGTHQDHVSHVLPSKQEFNTSGTSSKQDKHKYEEPSQKHSNRSHAINWDVFGATTSYLDNLWLGHSFLELYNPELLGSAMERHRIDAARSGVNTLQSILNTSEDDREDEETKQCNTNP